MKINFNYDKLKTLKGVAFALVLVSPLALTGCGKEAECLVEESHAHMYRSNLGYVRYIEDEHLRYDGYDRYDDYIRIDGKEDLYKFIKKKDLLKIEDNLDLILSKQAEDEDYIEYRYKYTYMQPIPHTRKVGKTTTTYYTYIPRTRYSWTSDPNHSRLTGETRLCHHMYVAYKVEKNDKGKYVLIPSDKVEDLTTIMDEYLYIKKDFTVIVTSDGKEADYEDGKEEDMSDDEKQRAEEYNSQEEDKAKTYKKEK